MRPRSEPDPIFLPDAEIAKRVSMSQAQWEATAVVLERSGLPKRDPLFNNQRCWPSVRAFLFRRSGHADPTAEASSIVENLDAFRTPRRRRAGT
ncbi:hypothetical protein [Lichenifustis flavocetrariae]|uniref:Uncharacterized protein n=1 Tax=Lichenifustis flavocetrariae TaxID=2949735 RepID=A0AA42CMW9_9HYPH|nr:hypothetical protein [Lichenifustis flavocetrariae]MCW6513144.1 hypothetical protein [Lichenifustis flavocetrariae]